MVRIVSGTKGLWDEWCMVRMVYTWYEKSVVRIVNGTKSPNTVPTSVVIVTLPLITSKREWQCDNYNGK